MLSVRDFGRLYEIASVLVRYGFGDMVRRIGLASTLERAGRALHWDDAEEYAHLPPPARVRRALEELGPAFVKLGQVLATRMDLFEPEWIAEFSRLHDNAQPVPYEAVRAQLTEDIGAPPEEAFAEFDPRPLAAASLAQVYRARLHEGPEVILKVQRPGIRPVVEADLRLLAHLAQLAESENSSLTAFHPREVVREFTHSLRRELDFASEARNGRRMARNFAGYVDGDGGGANPVDAADRSEPSPIVIPRVYQAAERLCVQEMVRGIPGTHLAEVDAAGLDRRLLARRGARAVLKMILSDGFFHADPHPGNVFYLSGNRIAFIDFGMVGRLTAPRREQLMQLFFGLVKGDPAAAAEVLLDWAGASGGEHDSLVSELEMFIDDYRGVPLGQLRIGEMLSEVVRLLRDHHLALPSDLALLIKAFVTLEGMGRELDPEFDMAGEALPMLQRALQAHYAPRPLLRRGWRALGQLLSLAGGLPDDFAKLLRAARRGRLDIRVDVIHLHRLGNQLDRAASRLTVGIVIAALIIGSSIVMTVPGGPSLLGLPFFGLLGFAGAVTGSIWLIVSIARSGRSNADPGG
ncbi:MAG TPA: AarF/UbiB family protein [Ramlibacter sp.]|nr:AarF/UbiB family protein [Ramlibacter sp.]